VSGARRRAPGGQAGGAHLARRGVAPRAARWARRRIGHTGTLDPFASGLLLLCLGPATRLAEYLTPLPKSYRAVMRLGERHRHRRPHRRGGPRARRLAALDEARVREALAGAGGHASQQLPPFFSAKKVGASGCTPPRGAARRWSAPRSRDVHAIELLRFDPPDVEFEVDCSSGTYIRAIARDVGEALGVGGAPARAAAHRASASTRRGRRALDGSGRPGRRRAALLLARRGVRHLPRVALDDAGRATSRHGGAVPRRTLPPRGPPVALLAAAGDLAGDRRARRGRPHRKPRKVFG
jgi:tRNA pseudouridine55 synthase